MPPMLEYLLPGGHEGTRFVVLWDGRILYLPPGRGPVYLVPDLETRERLERRFKVVDRVTGVALGAGVLLAAMPRLWSLVALLIVLAVLLPRWTARVVVESLPEAHDPDALRAAERHRPSAASLSRRLLGLVAGAALLGFGLYRLADHDGLSALNTISALAAGLVVMVTSLSGWGDERSDEYLTAIHAPPDNTPNEPKYY
jgi:hypothetical protein